MDNALTDQEMEKYVTSLITGDRAYCSDTVLRLLDSDTSIRVIYTSLFTKSLYRVGQLWQTNQISVAQEHLATSITESLFAIVYPKLFLNRKSSYTKKAIVSCVANEFHQIGGKIVADILEFNGVNALFLGANTPVADLLDMIQKEKPDFVALSVAIKSNIDGLKSVVGKMSDCSLFPIDIVAGGHAFADCQETTHIEGVIILKTIEQLEKYIAK